MQNRELSFMQKMAILRSSYPNSTFLIMGDNVVFVGYISNGD